MACLLFAVKEVNQLLVDCDAVAAADGEAPPASAAESAARVLDDDDDGRASSSSSSSEGRTLLVSTKLLLLLLGSQAGFEGTVGEFSRWPAAADDDDMFGSGAERYRPDASERGREGEGKKKKIIETRTRTRTPNALSRAAYCMSHVTYVLL